MAFAQSFPPIAAPDAEILILGSMPGQASLTANAYYAHPRNAFWPIICALLEIDAGSPYEQRVAALLMAKIAVWDVLQSCIRPGSLDADIDPASAVANDLPGFLATHPAITRIYFNGAKAESCFRQHVLPSINAGGTTLSRLPSTSPAHAALSFEKKLAAWRLLLG